MLSSDNFFHCDFPRDGFRALILEEANAEHDNWDRKCLLQDISLLWSDYEIFDWHTRMGHN